MHVYNSAKSEYLKHNLQTLGNRQDIDEEGPSHSKLNDIYSATLRGAIAETLILDPPRRISAKELVTRTKHGLKVARVMAGITDEPDPGITKNDEPLLDANWYSGQYQHPVSNFSCLSSLNRITARIFPEVLNTNSPQLPRFA